MTISESGLYLWAKLAILQTAFYDHYYRIPRDLKEEDVRTFLISSKTPLKSTLERFGYEPTKHPGVYQSKNVLIDDIRLILLNELSNSPHNVLFKVFASRLKEKRAAYEALRNKQIHFSNQKLHQFMIGLLKYWFDMGGTDMKGKLTPEKVMELGKQFDYLFWANVKPEDWIKKFKPEDMAKALKREGLTKMFTPEDMTEALKPKDMIEALKPKDMIEALKRKGMEKVFSPEDMIEAFKPEEIIEALKRKGLTKLSTPEESLKDCSIDEIEKHLEKLKKKSN